MSHRASALPARIRRRVAGIDLKGRLMMMSMLPVVFFACVWGAYVIHQRAEALNDQLRERANLLARQMAVAADYGVFSRNLAALDGLAASVAREPAVVSAAIYAQGGERLAHRAGEAHAHPDEVGAVASEASILIEQARTRADPATSAFGSGRIVFLEPILTPSLSIDDVPDSFLVGESEPGTLLGYVVVAVSTGEVVTDLQRFVVTVVGLLAAVLASSGWFVSRFSARMDRRLRELEQAARRIGSGETGVRLGTGGGVSFDRLARHINDMALQLEQSRQHLESRVRQATHAVREQRDSAERANQAKTRFLAAASHDLRQPMHALAMLLSALRQESRPEARDDLLQRAEVTSQAMSGLLDALLDISRLDAGGVKAHPEVFALDPLLLRLRETYEGVAERKGVSFVVRRSPGVHVFSDPMMLERILANFVSNAIRYTPAGGCVLVAVRRRGANATVQVRDNGVGIDGASQREVFKEFVQLHNPERNRSEGLGLGLAIVQRLARLLFHPINLRSAPGRGSTFSVTVPLRDPPAAGQTADRMTSPAGRVNLHGCRVLLAEDDELVRESYRRLLDLWGCEVIACADAHSALAAVAGRGWQPDVIVADYRLGRGQNGTRLIQDIRVRLDHITPALLVTGDTEEAHLRELDMEKVVVMFKPVRPAMLAEALGRLHWQGAAAGPKR